MIQDFANLATRPGFLIRRLHQIHVALFSEECGGFGVTPVQYSLLTMLKSNPDSDQVSIAHAIGIDRATIADVLARLAARGWIVRTPGKSDRRVKTARLTEAGLDLLHAIDPCAARAHARTLDPLSEGERVLLTSLLTHLVGAGNAHSRAPMDGKTDDQ
jgi:DNA-binding MarR family transcriptional regulator